MTRRSSSICQDAEAERARRVGDHRRESRVSAAPASCTCACSGAAWRGSIPAPRASLLEAANYIAAIENRTGLKIGCIEEIAYNQEFIDAAGLEAIIAGLPKNEYREYLQMVLQEGRTPAGGERPAR